MRAMFVKRHKWRNSKPAKDGPPQTHTKKMHTFVSLLDLLFPILQSLTQKIIKN